MNQIKGMIAMLIARTETERIWIIIWYAIALIYFLVTIRDLHRDYKEKK